MIIALQKGEKGTNFQAPVIPTGFRTWVPRVSVLSEIIFLVLVYSLDIPNFILMHCEGNQNSGNLMLTAFVGSSWKKLLVSILFIM